MPMPPSSILIIYQAIGTDNPPSLRDLKIKIRKMRKRCKRRRRCRVSRRLSPRTFAVYGWRMHAIRVSVLGGPEVLRLEKVDAPRPGPDELLVRVEAAGVNFIDTYHRRGLYFMPLPFIPGIEGAGTVLETGDRVRSFSEGDRVAFCLATGAYAEMTAVPAWKAVRLPSDVSFEAGATCMCQGMTAHYLTTDCFPLRSGQTALVHAAAGGVGLLLVQMARRAGARVIGTVSTRAKADLALEAGANEVILYSALDFEREVERLTSGEGVDVVYESVGEATFLKSLNCLRPRGHLVLYGQSSGPVGPLDPQLLNQKGSLFLTRPSLTHYLKDGAEFARRAGDVLRQMERGELRIRVGARFPLAEAAEAHRRLEGRSTVGKVLLLQ